MAFDARSCADHHTDGPGVARSGTTADMAEEESSAETKMPLLVALYGMPNTAESGRKQLSSLTTGIRAVARTWDSWRGTDVSAVIEPSRGQAPRSSACRRWCWITASTWPTLPMRVHGMSRRGRRI